MRIFVKFRLFYDARSPNMVMSHDRRSKFQKFLFCPNFTCNIRKSHKISSGKALYFRSYQPKTSRGWKHPTTPPPPPPNAFKVKDANFTVLIEILKQQQLNH